MRHIFLLILIATGINSQGQMEPMIRKGTNIQTITNIGNNKPVRDTLPFVLDNRKDKDVRPSALFINGKLSNPTLLTTIDPQLVDSIHIEKKDVEYEDQNYYGEIHLKMKKEYHPGYVSLADVKNKYAKKAYLPTIFMIDDDFIKDDYDQYFVDEKYILRIVVDTVENGKENLSVNVIQLITKTRENIEKSKEIRIR